MRANMWDGFTSTARSSSSSLFIPTFVVKPQRESGNKRSSGKHRIDKQCPSLPMMATWSKILQRQKLQQCIRQFNPFRITRCNVTATLITTIQISQRQVKEMKTILIYLGLRRGDLWRQQHGDKKTTLALSAFNMGTTSGNGRPFECVFIISIRRHQSRKTGDFYYGGN
ncbi:hypothetical protein BDB00DRAFT_514235 [Zychaea mexicana]|uniref:uncharacterized protein n=1 Tax=Zychaea mexicana TaxID=64656 RepID=UPI0022FDCE8E|nr:uncharacterized protein BDB00DRAFT_514235 [Zychaea mexicana]KAI9491119.1 hypothetical protein BDB00DRAFT_514235 [Zychaea mexicana]